jgi:hypothetical protein
MTFRPPKEFLYLKAVQYHKVTNSEEQHNELTQGTTHEV